MGKASTGKKEMSRQMPDGNQIIIPRQHELGLLVFSAEAAASPIALHPDSLPSSPAASPALSPVIASWGSPALVEGDELFELTNSPVVDMSELQAEYEASKKS